MRGMQLTKDEVTAVILAGGRSSRMGCDKTLTHLGATPIVLHQLALVAPFVSHAIIATNNVDKFQEMLDCSPISTQVVSDLGQLYEGPFAGILSAARCATTEWLFVRAVDMPWLEPSLVDQLFEHACDDYDAVVPRGARSYPEPLCALYRRQHVCKLQAAFDDGKRRVSTLFNGQRTAFIASEQIQSIDPQLISFQNINYPDQLIHAQKIFDRTAHDEHAAKGIW